MKQTDFTSGKEFEIPDHSSFDLYFEVSQPKVFYCAEIDKTQFLILKGTDVKFKVIKITNFRFHIGFWKLSGAIDLEKSNSTTNTDASYPFCICKLIN